MVGHLSLVGPTILRTKDTFQTSNHTTICMLAWIGLFNSNKGFHQALAYIFCTLAYITPMGTIRNTNYQFLSLGIGILYTTFANITFKLLIVHIRNSFEE